MKYIKTFNESKNTIEYKYKYDGEDNYEVEAYDGDKKIGVVVAEVLFDLHIYEFGDDFDEDEIYNIFPDDIIIKIDYMDVKDGYKGSGVGKELMKRIIMKMKEEGYEQFYLNASPMGFSGLPLDVLVNFYEKFGFKILKDQGNNVLMYNNINHHIKENKTFDKLQDLQEWFDEEKSKIEKVRDFKKWKFKSDSLFREYMKRKRDLVDNSDNPYALKGDTKTSFIYHYTDVESLLGIINVNSMTLSGEGISFSSHPNLYKRGFVFWFGGKYTKSKDHSNLGVKIKLDYKKMLDDGYKFEVGNEDIGTHAGEEELRLIDDELKNPLKYVAEVILFKDKENIDKAIEILNEKSINYKVV